MKKVFANKLNFIKKYFGGDPVIWFVFFTLCVFSIIEFYSASSQLVFKNTEQFVTPIMRHILFLFVGLVIVLVIHRIPVWLIRYLGYLGLLVSFGLLIYMTFKGIRGDEATRSIMFFGFFEFQPAELAKLSLVVVAADLLSRIKDPQQDEKKIFWWLIGISGIICAMIFKDGLSTSALLFLMVMILCFIQNISWKRIGTVLLALFAVVAIIFIVAWNAPGILPSALSRATTWVNRIKGVPEINDNFNGKDIRINTDYITAKGDTVRYHRYYYVYDVNTKGDSVLYQMYEGTIRYKYTIAIDKNGNQKKVSKRRVIDNMQVMNSKIAIARGVVGKFPGNSIQRDYLSKIYSDYIYAIIIEETSVAGGVFVILMYLILLFRAGMIAKPSSQVFHALLVFGVTLIIVVQALIHMMVVTDIGPVTGQPLPLFSRGGTSAIITCVYFGIILGVTRQMKEEQRKNNTVAQTSDENPQEEINIDDL